MFAFDLLSFFVVRGIDFGDKFGGRMFFLLNVA